MSNRNYYATLVGCAALFIAISKPFQVKAQENLSFKELVEIFDSLPVNKQLLTASQASEIGIGIAAMRPNPTISIGVENFNGSSQYKSFNSSETSFQVSQDLQLFGRRSANVNFAKSLAHSTKQEIEVKRQEFIKDLANLWLEFENAKIKSDLVDEQIMALTEDLKFITELVESGREPKLRQMQAQAELARSKFEKVQAQNSLIYSEKNINILSQYNGGIRSQIIFMDKMLNYENFNIAKNPNYQLLLSKHSNAKAEFEIARAETKPNIGVYLGARHHAAENTYSMSGGLSATIPLGSKNKAILEQRNLQTNANSIAIDNFVRNAEGQRLALISKISSASREITQLSESLAPTEEVYNLSKLGLKAGKISIIELQAARNQLFEVKEKHRISKYERAKAIIELYSLEGRLQSEVKNEK